MKKRAIRFGVLLAFLFGLASCKEYFPTSPSSAGVVKLTIVDLDSRYHTTENEPFAIGFDVNALAQNGLPIVGIPLDIVVIADEGILAIPEVITNDDGVLHALYYNAKPLNDYSVHLQIIASNDTLNSGLEIEVRPSLAAINAVYNQQNIYVSYNEKIEKSVSFRVTNALGRPVPYTDVAFRIISGEAAIESVAYADQYGLVRGFLTFTPTENCQIITQAEVRFVEIESDSKRRGIMQLNIIKNLPQLYQPPVRKLLKAESTLKVVLD